MNINLPSYPPPSYTPQSGSGSCSILKDLSEILEVILFNIYTHTYMYTHIYIYVLTCLFVLLSIWLSQGEFILVDLSIEHKNRVVMHGRAFNTGDDQFIHIGLIASVGIVNLLDMDALLLIPRDEMTIVRDAIGSFVS